MSYLPQNFLVWGELPVSDLKKAVQFYAQVTGADLTIDESGPNPMAVFRRADGQSGVALHLYSGRPADKGTGPTLHIAAEGQVEQIMDRVKKAGGQVVSDPIRIPAGLFFYAIDPDGNSVGFFEGTPA